LVAEVEQRVQPVDGFHPDVSAATAVASVGTSEFNELFPPQRYCSRPTVAGAYIDLRFVEKFHRAAIRLVLATVPPGVEHRGFDIGRSGGGQNISRSPSITCRPEWAEPVAGEVL